MKTLAPVALLLISLTAKSQSVSSYVINSAGNSYSQGYYNIDWSIGELALVGSMQTGNKILILTNGFLQPNLSDNCEDDVRHHFTTDEIKIFPNPTHGKIEVNFSTQQKGTLYLYVYDAHGKMLTSDQLLSSGIMISKFIDLSSFASGAYFLRVELNALPGSVSKTGSYKIVKL
jgi:hypothetical protein